VSAADLQAVADVILSGPSELRRARQALDKRPDNVLGLLLRALTKQEISILEHRGCRADDWTRLRVAEGFDPFRVRDSFFSGDCVLGSFAGEITVLPGLQLPCGIYNSSLNSCQVGNNCLIEKVRFAANTIIEHGAVVVDVGACTCSGAAAFGCDQQVGVAIETGGREVPVWAEMTVPEADLITRERHERQALAAITMAVQRYQAAITSPVSWIRRGARVRHVAAMLDVYVGRGASIDQAQMVRNCAVLSSDQETTCITTGAAVADCVLQWGVQVTGGAIVRKSVLLEHSGADSHGVIEESIIGPNTHIAKGEVTACLVGPFVGFHHQSMLIATLWPQGRGNVAYGAMVGSNHTGRAPDQELWAGEGLFFGLGCSIRFPSNFTESPYSVISAGVSTLPQRVCFPFSLITTPVEPVQQPRAFNELLPGWALYEGAYGLVRSEQKFAKRDKSRRHQLDHHILRPAIMHLVLDALDRLEPIRQEKAVYTEDDIPGIGKNFLRESARKQAVEAYTQALERYALRILLGEAEGKAMLPGSVELARQLADRFLPGKDLAERLRVLYDIEQCNAELVQRSKARDLERGQRVIPGYEYAHEDGPEDPVVASAWERVATTRARIEAVLGQALAS